MYGFLGFRIFSFLQEKGVFKFSLIFSNNSPVLPLSSNTEFLLDPSLVNLMLTQQKSMLVLVRKPLVIIKDCDALFFFGLAKFKPLPLLEQ
jgi:hypothetical protein